MELAYLGYYDLSMVYESWVNGWITVVTIAMTLLVCNVAPFEINNITSRSKARPTIIAWSISFLFAALSFTISVVELRLVQISEALLLVVISSLCGYINCLVMPRIDSEKYSSKAFYTGDRVNTASKLLLTVVSLTSAVVGILAASHPLDDGYSGTLFGLIVALVFLYKTVISVLDYAVIAGINTRGIRQIGVGLIVHSVTTAIIVCGLTNTFVTEEQYQPISVILAVFIELIVVALILVGYRKSKTTRH